MSEAISQKADELLAKTQIKYLKSYLGAALYCADCLEHALELGYLGEGSTRKWAVEALKRLQDIESQKESV